VKKVKKWLTHKTEHFFGRSDKTNIPVKKRTNILQ
jgi:hypothetical protein